VSTDSTTAVEAPARGWIGRPVPRTIEDVRFVTGAARYVDDLDVPDALYAAFVRSPYAHAAIGAISAHAALERPGVQAVYTAADFAGRIGEFPINPAEGAELAPVAHPVLATDRARYVGQSVAVVVADSAEAAVDAAEWVTVDWNELPVVVEPEAALAAETVLHEAAPDNVVLRWTRSEGAVDEAFHDAAHVVRQAFRIPRLIAAPIEPRGAVASYDAGDDLLTVWVSAQDQHRHLANLAAVLGRDRERIRVVVPDVGGAFGSKGVPAAETVAVALSALELGRPVKWIETRTENSLASYQGRGLDADGELALDADGRMLAIRVRLVADFGAYMYPTTPVPAVTAAKLLTGCYTIPAADVEVRGVCTNKVPTGPYRGAGRPEAALILERLVDLAARELGLDAVELRRRNLIPKNAFPYTTPLGFTYDSGDYEAALDRALDLAGETRGGGRGVALYVERVGPGFETASVTADADGRVVVRTGSSPHGQGHETTFAQIVADELGIDPAQVELRWGDSREIPVGMGTFASRSVTIGGSALVLALRELRAQLEAGAAHPVTADARFELPGPAFSSGAYVADVAIDETTGEVDVLQVVAVDDCGRVVNPLLAEGQVIGAVVQALGECLYEQTGWDEYGQPGAVNLYDYHLPTAFSVPPIRSALLETPSPLNPLGAKGVGEGGSIGTPAALANAVADALAQAGVRHLDPPFTPARVWKALQGA
jgi:aerobic carbon-monoxide dehydrogenase large subunit